MEKQPWHLDGVSPTICAVAEHRMLDARHVHADLVGTTRLQSNVQERNTRRVPLPAHAVVGHRPAPVWDHCAPHHRITTDRSIDRSPRDRKGPLDTGHILTGDGPGLHRPAERSIRTVPACDDQQARCCPVESVHDAPPIRLSNPFEIGEAVQQPRCERRNGSSSPGMHDQA